MARYSLPMPLKSSPIQLRAQLPVAPVATSSSGSSSRWRHPAAAFTVFIPGGGTSHTVPSQSTPRQCHGHSHSPLVERRLNPRWPRGRGAIPPPRRIPRDCSGSHCDGELKLSVTDALFFINLVRTVECVAWGPGVH